MHSFDTFGLAPELVRAVRDLDYKEPTPIQKQAIPHVMEGKDLLGCAQTGTGKTAAFALPILHSLLGEPRRGKTRRVPRALVLSPTRELANQISESFTDYGKHTGIRNTVVFGGVSQKPQADALREGIDVLVATPGRLLDLYEQKLVDLGSVTHFVLDEADRMLDMGFILDIRRIIDKLPRERQTLFFSATMPYDIRRLADSILKDPVEVAVTPVATPAELVEQFLYYVEKTDKAELLVHLLKDSAEIKNALVFVRTRHGAERLSRQLSRAGVKVEAIHGDRTQKARERALERFKEGDIRVLVATDVAARGLDIVDLSHVVNYDLPEEAEAYVHRIGRTGRAGSAGVALAFCALEERSRLTAIERLIRRHVTVVEEHPCKSPLKPGLPTRLETGREAVSASPFVISAADLFPKGAPAAPPAEGEHAHKETADYRPSPGAASRKFGRAPVPRKRR
jgi:ATP-dependent RNA helicase RhlE